MISSSTPLVADGSTAAITLGPRPGPEPFLLVLRGTWGGGTIKLQATVDDTNWVDCKDDSGTAITYTADCAVGLNLPPGAKYRLTLSGSTAPSLTWAIT